jgi:hypothetical protein
MIFAAKRRFGGAGGSVVDYVKGSGVMLTFISLL